LRDEVIALGYGRAKVEEGKSMSNKKTRLVLGLAPLLALLSMPQWATAQTPMAKTWSELTRLFPGSKECAECHKAHYQQWQNSYHSLSLTTSLKGIASYIASEQRKKGRFPNKEELSGCFSCHLPTLRYASEQMNEQVARLVLDGKKDELEKLAELNVGCAFCHSAAVNPEVEANVYYGPIQDPQPAIRGHQSRYSGLMSSSEFCRSCHSFLKTADRSIWCTLTYEAWKEGPASKQGVQCQYCHMKSRDDVAAQTEGMPTRVVHSHDFPGGHHPSILQDAVRLALSVKRGRGRLLVQVTMHNLAGHRIPDS
jgi:hypothetical protein